MTARHFGEIRYEKSGGVATAIINRPDRYNALSLQTLRELTSAFRDADGDDTLHAVVLTGTGTRAFSTGGDLKEYTTVYAKHPKDYRKYLGAFRACVESILHCNKPVIARINGMALGGGHAIQLACDLGVMADHAVLGQVGTSVGSVPCMGPTQWLPLMAGDRRAREMLMLNTRIPARKALEWGLVNAVAPSITRNGRFVKAPTAKQLALAQEGKGGYAVNLAPLDAQVAEMAAALHDKFPECMAYTKAQANHAKLAAWKATIGDAHDWLADHFASPEAAEGMRAFAEKRKVDFAAFRRRKRT